MVFGVSESELQLQLQLYQLHLSTIFHIKVFENSATIII